MAKYRKYSKDFKLQAAKLVTEQGYLYQQAALPAGQFATGFRNSSKPENFRLKKKLSPK
jgi:hypothetical protein